MLSRAYRSIAACASPSSQLLFLAQCLPSTRLLHQPDRRGRSLLSLSPEPETTGSAADTGGGVRAGAGSAASLRDDANAGSRTVERLRAGSDVAVTDWPG